MTPSRPFQANMTNALDVNEVNTIEQRKLVYFRALCAVVSVNIRVVWLDK